MSVYRKFDAATVLHHAKIEVAAAKASKPTKADTEVSKTLGALETLGAGPPRIHTSVGSESPSPEATDLRDLFEERAGIHQFDAGYRRDVAERLAYDATIEEWCRRHPQVYDPHTCAGCRQPLGRMAVERSNGARVHHDYTCMRVHGENGRRRAVKALGALGLVPPPGWDA